LRYTEKNSKIQKKSSKKTKIALVALNQELEDSKANTTEALKERKKRKTLEEDLKKKEDELAAVTAELNRSKMVIQKSSDQINYLLKSYKETSTHVIELKQQSESQKERLSRLQQRFTNMVRGHMQSVDNPEDQAAMLEEMLINMKNEMEALQKENEKLKLQLETVKKEADEALSRAQKLSVEVRPDRENSDTLYQLKIACSEITTLINQHESLKKRIRRH